MNQSDYQIFDVKKEKRHSKESDFYQWMIEQKAKPSLINKLIYNGYDSIEMLREAPLSSNELNNFIKELNLETFADKSRLKIIIKKLNQDTKSTATANTYLIIDKEESDSIIKMENKIKLIKQSMQLIADTITNIDEEIADHTKTIQCSFKECHKLLNEREKALLVQLNQIGNYRKIKLQNVEKSLSDQTQKSQQKINQCHESLKKQTEIREIEKRKKEIIKTCKDIDNIKVITNKDELITNNKLNIWLNTSLLEKTIKSFGFADKFGDPIHIATSMVQKNSTHDTDKRDNNAQNKKKQNYSKRDFFNNDWYNMKYTKLGKPKDPNAPKRPSSSYFVFMNGRRPILRKDFPNKTMTEIVKLIGAEWKSLSAKQKAIYGEKAAKLKEEYQIELAEYKKTNNYKKFQVQMQQWKAYTQQNHDQTSSSEEYSDSDDSDSDSYSKLVCG